MFTNKRLPENWTLEGHWKKNEDRVVEKVESETEKLISIKVAFNKEISFKQEKVERGPNGKQIYDRMKHYFKGPQHIITRETTKSDIRALYRKDMDDIQEEIDQWG